MATMKFFQCDRPSCLKLRKGRFYSEQPICPQCKTEGKDPKYGHTIRRLTIIHYDPPSEYPGIGMTHRACSRKEPIQASDGVNGQPNPWHAGTGSIAAVTCHECMKTPEFKKAAAALDDNDGLPPNYSAVIERLAMSTTPLR